MYPNKGTSVGGIYGEEEGARQKRLEKQRALLEQKKRQRQMQHGMMVAGGGRPLSSKSLRTRPSVGSNIHTASSKQPEFSRNFTSFSLASEDSVTNALGEVTNRLEEVPKATTVKILNTEESDIDYAIGRHLPTSQIQISAAVVSNSISEQMSSSSDEQPPLPAAKPLNTLQNQLSKSSNFIESSSPSILKEIPTSTISNSPQQNEGISAAAKLEALGIPPSLDYVSESESEEELCDGGAVLANPGAEDASQTSSPRETASACTESTSVCTESTSAGAMVAPEVAKTSEVTSETLQSDLSNMGIELTPEGDTIANLTAFVKKPAPDGTIVRCRVQREKRGMERSMFPTYFLFLDRGENYKMLFLLGARKRKKSRSSNYLVSTSAQDLSRESKNFVSKLRANFLGTSFTVYDNGENPTSRTLRRDKSNLRQELAAIHYETNVLGFKGPRKMTTIIPALNYDHQFIAVHPTNESETLLERWKNNQMTDLLELHNKQPVWSDETQAFVLNFHGRVTQASVKNFQLVHSADEDYIVLQFGRISDDLFTLDYRFPLSALQAFSIALSSFDSKLACE